MHRVAAYLIACWCKTLKLALMRSMIRQPDCYTVAFSDHLMNHVCVVGEGGVVVLDERDESFSIERFKIVRMPMLQNVD